MTARPHEALRRERSLARGAVSAEAQQEDNEAEDSEDANAAGRREASCDTADARPTAEPRDERSEVEGSRNFKDRERRGQLGKGSGELSLRRESEKRSGGSMEPSGGKARRARERERRKTRDRGRKRKVASSPLERRRAPPVLYSTQGLSTATATWRIIEAVEALVREFRGADRGLGGKRGPRASAPAGSCGGRWGASLARVVSALPAAETGIAVCALTASAAMTLVCILLKHSHGATVSLARFVFFLPLVVLAAWLAYRSRTIEHLRAVSKLQEALDDFKQQTGFACLSAMPWSATLCSPPPISLAAPQAFSPSSSSALSGLGARGLRRPKGLPFAAPSAAPAAQAHARPQDVVTCSASGLGGAHEPDYARLSPAHIFAGLRELVADPDAGPLRGARLGADAAAAQAGAFAASARGFSRAASFGGARDADAAEAAQRPVPEGDRHRQAGEEEARVLHESPLPAASLVAVLRDAQWTTIPRNMLAAGDIFKLRAGDPLPCDAVRVVPSFLVSRRRSRRRPAVRPSSSSPPRCGSPSSPRKKSPKGEHPAREGKSVSQPAASPSALHSPSASRADDAKATPRRRASFASAAGSPEGPPRRRSRRESLSFRGRKSGAAPGLEAANGDAGGAAWAPSRRRPSSLPPPSLSSSSASSPARAAPPRPPKLVLRPLLARGVYRAGAVFSPFSRSPPPPFSPAASTEGLDFSGSMRSPPSASPTRLGAPASPAASPSVAPSGGDGCADDATPRARSAGSSPASPFFALKASMFLSRPRRAELAVLRLRSRGASAALATDAAAGEPAACVGGAPCRRASPSRRRAREAPEEGLDEELRRQTRSKRRERLEVETGEDGDVARVLRHARGHRRDRRRRGDKEEARLRRAERERRRAVSRETDGKGEGRRKREKESRRRARAAPSSRARARRSGRGEDTLSDHGRRRLAVPHAWTNDGREDSRGLHRRAEASASRGRFSRVVADAYGPRGREAAPKHRDLWMDLAQHETQCPRRADSRLRGEALHSRPPPDVPSSDAVVAAAESDPEAPESSSCGDRQRISPLRGRHRQRPFVSPHSPPPPTPPSASACAAPGACSPAFPPLSPESSSAFLRAPFDFYSAVPPCPPGASSGSQSPAATSPRSRDARLQTFRLMRLFASSPSLAAARPLDSNAEEEAALLATAAAEAAQGAGDADREGDASDRDEAFEDASDSEFIEVCQVAPELASATFVALRTSCVGTLRTFLEASLRNPDSSRSRAKVPFFDTADLVSRRVALVWFIACAVCICAVIFWDVVGSSGAESIPVGLRIARWHLPINVTVCMLMAWPRILGELTDIWGNARLQSLFQEAHFRARQDACVDVEGEGRKCRSISSSSWTSDTSSNASPVSSTVSVSNVPLSKQIKELIYIFKRGLDGSSNLLHIMNSTTVLCFVDKDGILVDACRTIQEIAIGATTHAGGGGVSEPLPCLSPGRRPSLACRGAPRDRDAEAEAEAEVETRGDAQNSLQPSPSLLSDAPPDVALDADFAFSFHAEDAVRAAFRASSPSAPSHSDADASRSPAVETPRRERPRSSAISRRSEALGAAKPRVEGDDNPAQGLAWVGARPAPGRVAGGDRTVASPSARPSTCAAGAEENKGGGAGADADEPGGEGRSASPRRRFFRPLLLGKRGRGDAGRRGALPVLSPASYRGHAEGEVLSPSSAFSPEASPSCSSPPRLPSSPAPSSLTASLSSPNTSRGQKHWRARGKREEASGRRYDERDADDGAAAESAEEARAMQQRRRRRASSDDGRPWLVGERAEREERREDESEEERGCVLDEEFFALGDAFVAFDIGHDEEGREEALQEAEEALREAEALREEAFREEEEEEALREEEEAFREEEEALREEEEDEALRDEEEAFREEEEALREEEEEALRDEEAALTEEDEVYGRDQRGDDAEIEREEDTRPVTEFRKIVLDLMNDDECDAGLRFENDSWIEYTTQIKPLALAMALTQLPRPIRKSFADPSWLFALYVQDLFLPHPDRQVAHAELLDCQCSLARIVGMPEIFFQNFLPLRFALAVQPSPPQRPAPAPGRASLSSRLSPPSPPSPRSASARRAPPSAFSLLCGLRKRKPEYLAAQRLREEPQPPASEEENAGSQGDDEGSRGEDARDDSDAELTPEAHAVASEACAVAGGGVRAACGGAESAVEKLRRRRASRSLGIRRVTWADGPRRQNESSRRHSSPKDTCEAETDADDELDAGGAGRPRTPTSRSRSSPAFQPSPVCAARLPWPLSPSRSVSGRRRSILDAPEVPVLAHEVRDRVRLLADSAADVPAPCFRVLASHAAESRDARGSPASLTDDAETERDEEDAGRDECSRSDVRQSFAREKEDVVSTSRAADTSGSVLMLWVVRDAASKVVHLFVKGAPALLLPRVKFYLDGQHLLPFDSGAAHSLLELNNQWLSTGLDAVAFGYRPLQLEQETALLSLLKEQSVFSICQESSLAPALSLDLSTSSQSLRDASCDPASDEAAESAAARDRRANAEDARSEALGSGAAVEAGERWISIRCHIGERSAVGALALLPRLAASLSPRHSHSHGGRASRDACLRPAVGRASPGAGGGQRLDAGSCDGEAASMEASGDCEQRSEASSETFRDDEAHLAPRRARLDAAPGGGRLVPSLCVGLKEGPGGELLRKLQSDLVLLGMGASKQLCAKEVAARIQDLHEAGIRFVFFSSQGEKRTRALGAAFGLETGWNCIISLQPSATGDTSYVNMDGKIVLPSGIAAIRQHVREVDNVPLQVSLFCNATPDTVQEMMQVLQENNEVMTCVGSCLRMSNFPLFEQANASIATFVAPDARCRFCGGRCSNFAYHSLLPTLHPSLAFAADMNSLPCALQQSTYPVADPHVTMAVLYEAFRESRRLVDSIQQALTLSLSSAIFLSLFFLFNAFALVPNLLDFASLVLFLLLFTPLLSLALLANPKTDKLMKEHPYKPMDNAQTRHQLVVVFMHFAFRLVPSVIIISALTLAYMFDLGQALYAQLHEEIRLRASADALSARSPAALSVSSTAFSAFSEPQSSSSALLTRLPSDAAEALLRPRRLSAASEETAAGWAPDDRAWRGAAGLEPGAGGARDGREGPLGMQRRLQATEDEAVAMLLPYLENKCNRFRFDPSWLSGKWLACSDAIEEVGAALGEACFVRATSSPLVLGELFCFALVGVTLMLLSMSYIDRFESLFSIPPFRNRWWVACCVVLLLVIVLVVATRVTLHRRYISAADADVELATAKHARLLPSFARGDPARAVLSAAAFGVPRKIDATFPPSPPQAPWSAGDAREAGPRDATPHEAAASRTRRALELTSLAWPHWSLCLIAVILWFFVIVTDELVKRVERQTHEQNQKYLKVLFATRLGMWSPK